MHLITDRKGYDCLWVSLACLCGLSYHALESRSDVRWVRYFCECDVSFEWPGSGGLLAIFEGMNDAKAINGRCRSMRYISRELHRVMVQVHPLFITGGREL